MKKRIRIDPLAVIIIVVLSLGSCRRDDSPSGPITLISNPDIPPDPGSMAAPPTLNNLQPSATFSKSADNPSRIRINLLGMLDPATGRPIRFGLSKEGQIVGGTRLYVTEDTTLQGVKVSPVGGATVLSADVVFVVDNSGSMGEEADTIANKIISFSRHLAASGIDVRVGCVGYEYGNVNGARNLTDAQSLRAHLQRPGRVGTSRTRSAGGPDSLTLATAMTAFPRVTDENGILAISFAHAYFSWRSGAQRIYLNFTDEAIQTAAQTDWSAAGLQQRMRAWEGSIHTIFSVDASYWNGSVPDTSHDTYNFIPWQDGIAERPWSLSHFSGGTVKIVHSDGHDLDLRTLPVTLALTSSYLVEFESYRPTVPHTVTINIRTPTADGQKVFPGIVY